MAFDPYRPLKNALGRFATGVTVAGCIAPDGAPLLVTVNSFTSVSLEPSLVLWCLERKATSFPAFMAADAYAITVLHAGQQAASERFSRYETQRPAPADVETMATGAPVLKERLAAFDCRVKDRHVAGDHVILVAQVAQFDHRAGAPLLYFASRYVKGPEAEE